jgi:hypothetical protein
MHHGSNIDDDGISRNEASPKVYISQVSLAGFASVDAVLKYFTKIM